MSSFFDEASLVFIPSGYKTSKAYSVKPTSGDGDLTFTRASTATRTNASGAIVSVASNVPRLDYSGGATCPRLLLEPQRTNLVFPSNVATTQTRTVTATAHTLTFYGTGTVVLSGVATGTLTGTGANNRVTLTFTPTAGSLILTVSGTVTNWQLEAGAFSSTLIETTTAAVTRLADGALKTGISSLIGQQEGVVYWEGILPQESTIGPSQEVGMFNTERQPATRTALTLMHRANTGTLFARMFIGNGTFTPIITLSIGGFASGTFAKIAFAYKSGDSALYINGIQRATSSVTYTSVTTMNDIHFNDNVVVYGYTSQQSVSQAILFKTRLTNSQLAELTTL